MHFNQFKPWLNASISLTGTRRKRKWAYLYNLGDNWLVVPDPANCFTYSVITSELDDLILGIVVGEFFISFIRSRLVWLNFHFYQVKSPIHFNNVSAGFDRQCLDSLANMRIGGMTAYQCVEEQINFFIELCRTAGLSIDRPEFSANITTQVWMLNECRKWHFFLIHIEVK